MKTSENTDTVSIGALIEDLKNTDPKARLHAIKNIHVISNGLGKERTRSELLPFIMDLIDDEEDDNLVELSKILGSFLELVGGKPYVLKLVKILETLLSFDEGLIQSEAIKSLKTLFLQVNISEIETQVMEIMNKLFNEEAPINKISIIQLIPAVYPFVSNNYKAVIVGFIQKIACDENLSVKREFFNNLKDLVNLIDDDVYIKLVNQLIKESNESIRGTAVDCLVALRTNKNCIKHYDFLFNSLTALSADENWRIKYIVGDKINEFLQFPSLPQKVKTLLADIIVKLLEDKDPEIRTSICLRLDTICDKMFKEESFERILKQIKKLETDPVIHVRASLATNILKICPLIGKSKTNDYVFPLFLNFLKDENHEIRVTLLKNVEKLNEVIPFDIFSQSVFPAVKEILTNKNWRVRVQLTDCIPVLAKIVPKDIFLNNLLVIALSWLTDNVFAIREGSCKVIKKLYDNFKCEEMERRVIDKLNDMTNAINYLVRNSALFLIKEFIEDNSSPEFNERYLFPIIFKLSKDKVSNVRLNCALIIKKGIKIIKNKDIMMEAKAVYEEFKRDSDADIFALLNDSEQ